MSYGQAALNTLLNDASITALLTDSRFIFNDVKIPASAFSDGVSVGAEDSTINYYRVSPVSGGQLPMQVNYSINCRAASMAGAEAINRAVFDVVNRHSSDSVYFVADVLATIPPQDETDLYNAPLEVVCKARTI